MPPKKKAVKVDSQEPKIIDKAIETKKEQSKPEAKVQKSQSPQIQHSSHIVDTAQKILSEEELVGLRKLRFGNVIGTQIPLEEAQHLKQDRLKKFGGAPEEDLQKRKLKFSGMVSQDQQTVQKRLAKFGNSSNEMIAQPQDLISQRKKKFGSPDFSLDDIKLKTKPIHKQIKHPQSKFNRNNFNNHKNHFNNRR